MTRRDKARSVPAKLRRDSLASGEDYGHREPALGRPLIPRPSELTRTLALAAAYAGAGAIGLFAAVPPGHATSVWPSSGLAVAALLLWGDHLWPGVWLGNVVLNASVLGGRGDVSLARGALIAAAIGCGAALSARLSSALVRRFAGDARFASKAATMARFVAAGALLGAIPSPTIGSLALCLGGVDQWHHFGASWLTWWLGDLGGVVVVAPLVVAWARPDADSGRHLGETAAFAATLVATSAIAFFQSVPLGFTVFPTLMWAAFRFGLRGSTAALLVQAACAVAGTVAGRGPFVGLAAQGSLLLLQAYVCSVGTTQLLLSAVLRERSAAHRALAGARGQLGIEVDRRTQQLRELARVTERVNAGRTFEEILGHVWEHFDGLIPYDRIGVAIVDDDGVRVRASWTKTRAGEPRLGLGFSLPFGSTSLADVAAQQRPRVINDLPGYLAQHPASVSTRLIVEEGMCSSLTCPLVGSKGVFGFLFFSSTRHDAYRDEHVDLYLQLAGHLATTIEKGRMIGKLVELNALKDRVLGMAAHDLRSPLTISMGYLELLATGALGPLSEQQQEIVGVVLASFGRMETLTNDLVDLTAIESGTVDLHWKSVDLRLLLTESTELHRMLAGAKFIDLDLDVDLPPEAATVPADPRRIQQVLDNLITNAVKFSFPGGRIRLTARVEDSAVAVSVSDQGQGIPEADLERIFTPFGRSSARPTGGERSTGLGLAIAKRLVEAHDGRLGVESHQGTGSTFRFTIPLQRRGSGATSTG